MLPWVLASLVGVGPAVEIEWDAPDECPTRAVLIEELDAFIDPDAAGTPERVDQVHATIEKAETGWKLHLKVEVEGGVLERTLDADNCELLGSAAALMISVLVHPTAVVESIAEATEAAEAADSKQEPELTQAIPAPPPESPAQLDSAWTPSIRIGAEGGLGIGLLPGLGADTQLQLGVAFKFMRVEIVGHYTSPRVTTFSEAELEAADIELPAQLLSTGVGARVGIWAMGARACGTPNKGRLNFPLCVGFEGGQFMAEGIGLEEPRSIAPTWFAVQARAGIAVALVERLSLQLSTDAILPLTHPEFAVPDVGVLHTIGAIGARFTAGFAVDFSLGGAQKASRAAKTTAQGD